MLEGWSLTAVQDFQVSGSTTTSVAIARANDRINDAATQATSFRSMRQQSVRDILPRNVVTKNEILVRNHGAVFQSHESLGHVGSLHIDGVRRGTDVLNRHSGI